MDVPKLAEDYFSIEVDQVGFAFWPGTPHFTTQLYRISTPCPAGAVLEQIAEDLLPEVMATWAKYFKQDLRFMVTATVRENPDNKKPILVLELSNPKTSEQPKEVKPWQRPPKKGRNN